MVSVKVCSFPRSGTHLLMAYIYHNFDVGPGLERIVFVKDQQWSGTGTQEAVVPWAGLFGAHHPLCQARRLRKKEIVYIYRNPINCLYSNWKFFSGEDTSFLNWLSTVGILNWQQHVQDYRKSCFSIKYEDLRDDPERVLTILQRHFKLKRRRIKDWILIKNPVGWTPRKKFIDHPISDEERDLITEILDPKLMEELGYV